MMTTTATAAGKAFLRGLPIAALQACGVLATTRGNLLMVCASVFAINWWWCWNVTGVPTTAIERYAFAAGAACGSVLTVWAVR